VKTVVDRVDKVVGSASAESVGALDILKAKNELAQIIGDLERLQFKEVGIIFLPSYCGIHACT
jgi:hypothetical protein